MRTGLVLGAGGHVGQAFHLGVLSALHELAGFDGREADVLVGTSAGSLVAGGLAAGLCAADLRAALLGRPLSREGSRRLPAHHPPAPAGNGRTRATPPAAGPTPAAPGRGPLAPLAVLGAARHPLSTRPAALLSGLLPAGLASTDGIRQGIGRLHGAGWPERDLRICAVRARDAQRVVFGGPAGTRGTPGPAGADPGVAPDVGTAVAASCAIPAYFSPVWVDGQAYVDGGVHSPTNADVLGADRLDLVVVLSPLSAARRVPRADFAVRLAAGRYLAAEVRRLRRAGTRVVVFQPTPADLQVMGPNPMRGGRVADIICSAARSVGGWLAAHPGALEACS